MQATGQKLKFYWTGNLVEDAGRINQPHTKIDSREDRTDATISILNSLDDRDELTRVDMLDIQEKLLDASNPKGDKSGIRTHQSGQSYPRDIDDQLLQLLPVKPADKVSLLNWYSQMLAVEPLSCLNHQVLGIMVSLMYRKYIKKYHN